MVRTFNGREVPQAIRSKQIAARYGIGVVTAKSWIRRLIDDGVCRRIGGITIGRLGAVDEWVANGGRK